MKDQKLESYLMKSPGTESLRETITIIENMFRMWMYTMKTPILRDGKRHTYLYFVTETGGEVNVVEYLYEVHPERRDETVGQIREISSRMLGRLGETEESLRMKIALRGGRGRNGEMTARPVQLHKTENFPWIMSSSWEFSEVNVFWSLTPEDPSLPERYNEALRTLTEFGNLFGMRPVVYERFMEVRPPMGGTPYKDPDADWHFRLSFLPEKTSPNGKTTALCLSLLFTSNRHPVQSTTAYEMGEYYPLCHNWRITSSAQDFQEYVSEASMKCLEKFMGDMLYMTSISDAVPPITVHDISDEKFSFDDIPDEKFSLQLPTFSTMDELRMKLSLQGRIGPTGRLKEIERLGE